MARFLNCKTLKDRIPTSVLLNNINMLSINQLNAKIKIIEIWKAINIDRYPLVLESLAPKEETASTRAMTAGRLIEMGKSNLAFNSCIGDAVRLWNRAPEDIKNCKSLSQVKNAAKTFVKSLPL